jgi:hypothetical protein
VSNLGSNNRGIGKGLFTITKQRTCQIGALDLFPNISNGWSIFSKKVNIKAWEIKVIKWENKCQYDCLKDSESDLGTLRIYFTAISK